MKNFIIEVYRDIQIIFLQNIFFKVAHTKYMTYNYITVETFTNIQDSLR